MVAAAVAAALGAGAANASTFTDPPDDFLSTFTGAHDADLDIRSLTVNFDQADGVFDVTATFDGKIDTAEPGAFVLGIDTGAGAKNFGSLGNPGVVFDQTFTIQKDGSTGVQDLNATIGSDSFNLVLPTRLLTNTGFDDKDFRFSLWSKSGNSIADFAPNNDTLRAVPEPATWAMMILGFGMAGASLRRRRAVLAA
jgi:hypothetical protein